MNGSPPSFASLLGLLHLALAVAWFAAATRSLARQQGDEPACRNGDEPADRTQRAAALLMAATIPLYLSQAGWWLDMPGRSLVPAALALGLVAIGVVTIGQATVGGLRQHAGRLALLAFAGFYLMFGALALHRGTPVAPVLATKSLLLGAALLLAAQSGPAARRLRPATTLALLVGATLIGIAGKPPS